MSDKNVTLAIDGREIMVPEGTLVIRAAEMLGIYVPRFCDHPYLEPLGACRQCMVEVEGQRKPLTSCTTVCTDGMVVKTQHTSAIASDAQEGVLELLLINHPLDCPQCDKGGECPLQDQTLQYGPGISRFVDRKRRYVKPVPVNELVYLDRERCVLCARCTRFASEISGDPFIELFERGALEQVAVFEDEPYDSNFSGNVIQICPVGALTSRDFRFLARPFDMVSTDSTCTQCASGCAINVQERRDRIVRVLAGEDRAVNDAWTCDKGRFAHAYVGDRSRIVEPMIRKTGELVAVSWIEAVRRAADHIRAARENGEPVSVLTGGTLLDEDALALSLFAGEALGGARVGFVGSSTPPGDASAAVAHSTATSESIERAALVVVVGADLYEEAPIVYLRVRKAYRRGARVIEVNPRRTKLPGETILAMPHEFAAALERLRGDIESAGDGAVVLAGERPGAVGAALAAGGRFGWVPRKAGARTAAALGLLGDATPVLEQMAQGRGVVVVAGADPAADHPDAELAVRALAGGATIVALDMFETATTRHADVILPAAAHEERDGTITAWDGRARPLRMAVEPAGLAAPDFEILARVAGELGVSLPRSAGDLRARAQADRGTAEGVPLTVSAPPRHAELPFALVTYRMLLDAGTLTTGADELAAATRKPFVELNTADAARLGIARGDLVRLTGPRGAAEAEAAVGDSVAEGVVFVPADQPGLRTADLAAIAEPVPFVRVERA